MLNQIKNYIRGTYGNLLDYFCRWEIGKLSDGDYFLRDEVPSYTQWESRELVGGIIRGEINTQDDPLWMDSWAVSKEEYEMYSWQICGITCLNMILGSLDKNKNYRLVELAKDAEEYWVYRRNNNPDIRYNLDGLFHKTFLKYIEKFWLRWKLKLWIKENYIAHLVRNNNYIIASVHPSIREEIIENNSKKWHLILVVGFRVEDWKIAGFFINNPSGYYNKSQQKHFVNIDNWRKVFSGNVDVIECFG